MKSRRSLAIFSTREFLFPGERCDLSVKGKQNVANALEYWNNKVPIVFHYLTSTKSNVRFLCKLLALMAVDANGKEVKFEVECMSLICDSTPSQIDQHIPSHHFIEPVGLKVSNEVMAELRLYLEKDLHVDFPELTYCNLSPIQVSQLLEFDARQKYRLYKAIEQGSFNAQLMAILQIRNKLLEQKGAVTALYCLN